MHFGEGAKARAVLAIQKSRRCRPERTATGGFSCPLLLLGLGPAGPSSMSCSPTNKNVDSSPLSQIRYRRATCMFTNENMFLFGLHRTIKFYQILILSYFEFRHDLRVTTATELAPISPTQRKSHASVLTRTHPHTRPQARTKKWKRDG